MKVAQQLDILYVGTLPPHQGGSAIVGDYLLRGLAGLGHRVRALAPTTTEASFEADQFASQHREVDVKWFRVPYFSNMTSVGSTDAAYQAAEQERISEIFPALLADRKPDLVILGRESVASHETVSAMDKAIRSVLLVHGGTTFDAMGKNTQDVGQRRGAGSHRQASNSVRL